MKKKTNKQKLAALLQAKKKAEAAVKAARKARDKAYKKEVTDKAKANENKYNADVKKDRAAIVALQSEIRKLQNNIDSAWSKMRVENNKLERAWNDEKLCQNIDKAEEAQDKAEAAYNRVCYAERFPPTKGKFIGYKKVYTMTKDQWGGHYTTAHYIAKLEIPANAKRSKNSSITQTKCRASAAKVLSITTLDGQPATGKFVSGHDHSFEYKVGAVVKPKHKFHPDPENVCASGIHFFLKRQQAVNW